MNILVVDADPDVCSALSDLLRRADHQVTCVGLGSKALTLALQHDFDLLLCDVVLPDISGIEVIRAVKAQAPQLPVVVLSSAPASDWEKACEDAGAATFMSKPVMPAALIKEVSLVQKARLTLRVALVDTDRIHRTRLTKTLGAMGCSIQPFSSAAEALHALQNEQKPSLWVADASDPDIFKLLGSISPAHTPVFAFSDHKDSKHEENLMRAGAALFLAKPIDIDTLLTQASFLAR